MNKQAIIIISVFVLLLCVCAICSVVAVIYYRDNAAIGIIDVNQGTGTTLDGDGYKVTVPSGWEVRDQDNAVGAEFMFPVAADSDIDGFAENLNVIVQNTQGMNFEDYSELSMEQLDSGLFIIDSRIVSQDETTLDGYPAYRVVYTNEGTDVPDATELNFLVYWTVADDQAFVITFAGDLGDFDKYIDDIDEELVPSFRVE